MLGLLRIWIACLAGLLLCTPAWAQQSDASEDTNAAPIYLHAWLALEPWADEIDAGTGEAEPDARDRARRLLGRETVASAIRLYIRASRCERCEFVVPEDIADEPALVRTAGYRIRTFARVLKLDAERCLGEGDTAGAAARYATLVRVADHAAEGAPDWLATIEAVAVARAGIDGLVSLRASEDLTTPILREATDALARLEGEDPMHLRAGLLAEAASPPVFRRGGGLLARLQASRQEARSRREIERVLEVMATAADPVAALAELHAEIDGLTQDPMAGTYAETSGEMLALVLELRESLQSLVSDPSAPPQS